MNSDRWRWVTTSRLSMSLQQRTLVNHDISHRRPSSASMQESARKEGAHTDTLHRHMQALRTTCG